MKVVENEDEVLGIGLSVVLRIWSDQLFHDSMTEWERI